MSANSRDLTRGRIPPMLLRLTLPMLLGMVSMTLFNLADTMYVGWLGKTQLAALSFTFPVVMVLNSIAMGVGIGGAALVSTLVGAGDRQRVRRLSTDALVLGFILALAAAAIGEWTIRPLFRLLGAEGQVLEYIVEYMRIWYPGLVFVVVPMVGNNLIRATGDMKVPGLIMTASALINIVLDPLLIFGPGPFPALGVSGAALATLISRALSMVISLRVVVVRERMLDVRGISGHGLIRSWRSIMAIGLPAALTYIITPLSMGVITRMVAGFGTTAVAGFGVATRLEMLVMMVLVSLASVLVPFSGQNRGAGRMDRVRRAVRISFRFAMFWSLLMLGVFLLFGRSVAGVFSRDAGVVRVAVTYMVLLCGSYTFQGFLVFVSSVLNALKRPIHSLSLALVRLLLFYIPLAWLGSRWFGLAGIFAGAALANIIAGLVSVPVLARITGPLGGSESPTIEP